MNISKEYNERLAKQYNLETSDSETMPALWVSVADVFTVIQKLKTEHKLDYLHSIAAVHLAKEQPAESEEDHPSWEHNGFELVYQVSSLEQEQGVALKVALDQEAVPSIDSLFLSANWFEREVFDLHGIMFENSQDLSRIMLPPDWVGHPLRKDYVEATSYNGMSTTREDELLKKRVI